MDDEFDTSVDTSSFDDTGSDFSDTSSFDTSTDVGEIMDDSSFEVADTLDESDFSDYDMSGDTLEVDDLMSDTSDENIETLDTSDLDSDVTEDDSEGIESLMDDTATDEFSEVGDTLEETDFGVESDIVDLMDEAALETTDETTDVSGEEVAETDEISELMDEGVGDSIDETVESLEDTDVVEDLSEDTVDDIESLMDDSGEEVVNITEETSDTMAEVDEETSDVSELMNETDLSTEEVSDITDESLEDAVEETDTVEDMAEETTSDITDDIVADVSDNDASDNVTETIEDDVGEVVSDLPEGEVSGETVEAIEDAGDSSAYDRLSEYYSSHNYGQGDYAEYSQDPEWQELNNAYLQEIGQEPIEYGSDTDASAYDRLSEYYSSHNYGQGDYAEYSKDPEWQALNNEYLQELGQEPIDYSENDWTDTHVEDFRDELVALGIPEDSPELDAIIENEQQGIDEINSNTPIDESGTEDLLDGAEEIIDETHSEIDEGVDGKNDLSANDEIAEITPLENLDGWLKDINPNYDAFDINSPYSNNCGSCTYAVYQRLEGNPDICATAENIGYNSEMEALTGMEQVSMSPQEIEARLLEQGDGAHAIIGIDRSYGPGHWFNAACIDGKVVAIDGQSGEINDWPPDYGDVVNWEMSVKKGE